MTAAITCLPMHFLENISKLEGELHGLCITAGFLSDLAARFSLGNILAESNLITFVKLVKTYAFIAEWETRQHNRAAWAPCMYIYICISVTLSVCLGPRGSFYM